MPPVSTKPSPSGAPGKGRGPVESAFAPLRRRTAGARASLKHLWLDNALAALWVLLGFKLALAFNQVFGTEAYASFGNILGKVPLVLGHDVLGAALWASVITLLVWPVRRHLNVVRGLSALLQAVHGLFIAVGFYATLILGGPLTKAVLDLATMQDRTPGGGEAALGSSIGRYLRPSVVAVFAVAVLFSAVAPWLAARVRARLPRLGRRIFLGVWVALAITTVGVLPNITNGQWAGIRVHTYGLERSAVTELAWSYTRPILKSMFRGDEAVPQGFVLDLKTDALDLTGQPLLAAQPKKTNVILISLESVGAVYLSDPTVMPFLGSLDARPEGVAFNAHYTTWPQTMKSFFSVLCAELPYPDYKTISMVNPAIPCKSVSEALHDQGWRTALVTSADLGYDRKMRFFKHRAFDHVVDMHSLPGRENYWNNSWGVDEKSAVAHILDLMGETHTEPLFIFYELFTAHHPYDACREHAENPLADDREAYLRALRYIDARMKDLVEGLAALGHAEDTLIVFFADHGEAFGQHPGSVGHGPKVYQEAVRVPVTLLGPQLKNVMGAVEFPTSHIDLAPTILGLVGVTPPCTMKGRDLTRSTEARVVLFGGRPPNGQLGLVDGPWKYILNENGQEELYHLPDDPEERTDLTRDHTEQAAGYRKRLKQWVGFSTDLIEHYATRLAESDCRP